MQAGFRECAVEVLRDTADGALELEVGTPKGEEVVARTYPLWEKAQKEVVEKFTDQDYAGLLTYLTRLQAVPRT